MSENPLLSLNGLPPFSKIKPEHIEPAINEVLESSRQQLHALLTEEGVATWSNLVEPLEKIADKISRTWSPISHMNSVVNSDKLREAYNACLPKLSEYMTEMGQNEKLFQAYQAIQKSPEFAAFDETQQKIIENAIRDFRLSGVDLPDAKKQRYKNIMQQLSNLTSQFDQNLLDATHAWTKQINQESDLAGLPDSVKNLAEQAAKNKEQTGWLLTLEFPSYYPVMLYADNRLLREEMYRAYVTRASELGPHAGQWDNSKVMTEIMNLRHEAANLLGFENYAQRSLATKMAESTSQVLDFLQALVEKSLSVAKQEFTDIETFAAKNLNMASLAAWDIPYVSEKLRQHTYAISQEALKPYFSQKTVLQGMFNVVHRLYSISITEEQGVDTWHQDVMFFTITDNMGCLRGQFYLDLYARPHKRGGAWMDECLSRMAFEGQIQTPVAYLTCNFTPPVGDKPALFTHDEVNTLFHEFGHGLHHMLTKIDYPSVSGISGVPWDAVELPSQFMENWCWEKSALAGIAKHYETGDALPDELYQKMTAAKNFQSSMQMVRQLELAIFDLRIHLEHVLENGQMSEGNGIYDILNDVRKHVAVISVPEFNRFAHGFSHIFAGGYAAGYYSYKWAEVLSADAFSRFEEDGVFNQKTGQCFLENILEKGGSADPMTLFMAFRGRAPKIDALLRHSGIVD